MLRKRFISLRYAGPTRLPEFAVYNYKARANSLSLGRFMQVDAISLAGGMNLYGYVGKDPVNAVDPMGMQTFSVANRATIVAKQAANERQFGVDHVGTFLRGALGSGDVLAASNVVSNPSPTTIAVAGLGIAGFDDAGNGMRGGSGGFFVY